MSLGGVESNPAVAVFLDWFGWPLGLLANRAVAIGLAWVLWLAVPSIGHVGPRPYRYVVPAMLAGRGLVLVVHNTAAIAALW